MRGLTDSQLKIIMRTAADLPVEKRSLYLQRVVAMLDLHGRRLRHGEFTEIAKLALRE
jgi:hypothetical protein